MKFSFAYNSTAVFFQPDIRCYIFGFNGKEKTDEWQGAGMSYDFGERIYDPRIARWLSIDYRAEKYPAHSPYTFGLNNPICNIDKGGDSVWVTVHETKEMREGKMWTIRTITIHVRGAVLNASKRAVNMDLLVAKVQEDFATAINAVPQDIYTKNADETVVTRWKADIQIRQVQSMSEVNRSDNLMVIVDQIYYKTDDGEMAGGVADEPGKIGYVKNIQENYFSFANLAEIIIHEFGHQLGMSHQMVYNEKTDKYEIVRYGTNYSHEGKSSFSAKELQQVKPSVGNTLPYIYAPETQKSSISTNERPYQGTINKGEKIPKPGNVNFVT